MELTGNKYTRNDWRAFLSTRRGTVLVAAACAVIAAAILVVAMQSYRHHVNAEGNPETVLVATGLIQKGTSGDAIASEQLFKRASVATKQASSGAIADTAALHGRVAAADIYPGQQLTVADFTPSGGLAGQLAPNQRAMTITMDSAHGMIGQVHDGDHVDVYAGVNLEPTTGRNRPVLRLLMSDITVLRAGSEGTGGVIGGGGSASQQSNVTLDVPDELAGALAFAADNGKVWLALRPANATTSPPAIFNVESLLVTRPTTIPGGKP